MTPSLFIFLMRMNQWRMTRFHRRFSVTKESISFYRKRHPQNLENYPKFSGQTRNPIKAIYSDIELCFGEDNQPEPFLLKIDI